ncbi:hypothetical protein ACHAPU_009817 [Fusarium lateritium]
MSLLNYETHPITSLTAVFTAWKGFLLAIALGAAIGPDYDTSTSLFFDVVHGASTPVPALATRLTRWDALYFMHDAVKGKVYEQEWAFGIGMPAAVRSLGGLGIQAWEPLVAIAISHISHLVAVLALYQLTIVICNDRRLAYLAAVVHVLSPAGLFLSAPYAESPFSCLSFVGNLLFAVGLKNSPDSVIRNAAIIGAGLSYGVSCTFRSNGLFGGVLFTVEAVKSVLALLDGFTFSKVLRLIAPVVGGILVAVGFVAPQVLAWLRYCSGHSIDRDQRPWCGRHIPSIYTFVQEEYWNVGFLKYWTPNQIPLFLLAAPMLTILIKSGTEMVREPSRGLGAMVFGLDKQCRLLVRTLAAVQTLIAVLAITNYHVQIISRLSSGYPVWYWWVASCLMDKQRQSLGYGLVVFITMYAVIQGGLFASFLPPA